MPPNRRPFPRYIADASAEGRPYGRWEDRLRDEFASASEPLADEAGSALDPETIRWFPDRSWGGRVYVPASGRATEVTVDEDGEETVAEYYGWVSFAPRRSADEGPADLFAKVDFTDVTADDNPDWQIDLNDDVIGRWRTDGGRGGDVTLIWGLPLIRGAVAATAELDGESLDQAPIVDGRFTPDRGRRGARLRRRPLPRDQALGPRVCARSLRRASTPRPTPKTRSRTATSE